MTKLVFRTIVSGADLRAQLAADRVSDATADAILELMELPHDLSTIECLRVLAELINSQRDLPRDAGRDGRFLLNLEHALRDLALRPHAATGAAS